MIHISFCQKTGSTIVKTECGNEIEHVVKVEYLGGSEEVGFHQLLAKITVPVLSLDLNSKNNTEK